MLRRFKKYFIPHEGNQYHPHLLRTEATIFLLGFIFFAEAAFLLATLVLPGSSLFSTILPATLIQATNNERQALNEPTLSINPLLERAAQLKAQDMVQNSYFAHTSPQGIAPWYWLDRVGYRYAVAGENLAVNFLDSADVHTAWMKSPSHRANIVNQGYSEIGIATATGMYKGYETTFVVQFFGKPKTSITVAKAAAAVTTIRPTATSKPSAFPVVHARPVALDLESPSITTTLVASPHQTVSRVLMIIGGLVVLALALTIFIKKELPHPRLALKPMFVILVIVSLLVINGYISGAHASISSIF